MADAGDSNANEKPKSRRPEDTPFKQQRLTAWQPILTPSWVIGTFFFFGVVFIPIGIVLKTASDKVIEYSIMYDGPQRLMISNESTNANITDPEKCLLEDGSSANSFSKNHTCQITFTPDRDMQPPVFVYYHLNNFYQNHRRYVQSKNDEQLRGTATPKNSNTTSCDSIDSYSTLVNSTFGVIDDTNATRYPYPCGLIATSMFNDIIWLRTKTVDGQELKMVQEGIAWESDVTYKFSNPEGFGPGYPRTPENDNVMFLWNNPKYYRIVPGLPNQAPIENVTAWTEPSTNFGAQNEHFIVWMRTAGLPNFRKLYGKIYTPLKAGVPITFEVQSNFFVRSFDGSKYLVISTTSWFGGYNPFLGIAYITIGSLSLLLALLFFMKHKLSPRKLGDTRYLVWKNRQG